MRQRPADLPVTELAAKVAILLAVGHLSSLGVSHMSLTGWFDLIAVWLVFGVLACCSPAPRGHTRRRAAVARGWALGG